MAAPQRLVVVGAGIGGLAAAWSVWERARELGRELDVLVLEREQEVGGKARSVAREGWLVEGGPTGYLDNEPVLDELVRRAGLAKLPADEAAAHRFIVRGGRAREVHPHPLRFAASGILSPLGLLRVARERWVPRRTDPSDESVFDFARRRLGAQAAERLISPMVLGVFAGDARRLSLRSAFPRMAELEEQYGSLFVALGRLKKEKRASGGPSGPAGALTSFAGGLQELPRALADKAPFRTRTGAGVAALAPSEGAAGWRVVLADGEALAADAVVLAGEVFSTADLLREPLPAVAAELGAIPCPGVAVVALGYGEEALARMPRGFGALIPRGEGLRILGALWDTHLFPGRSPSGRLLVRAMLGGATDPEAAGLSADELVELAHRDLARLFGLERPPGFREVVAWPRAIPQYELGHAGRRARVDAALGRLAAERPGLHLAGNYLEGVAFGKAAARAWRVGREAAERLAPTAVAAR